MADDLPDHISYDELSSWEVPKCCHLYYSRRLCSHSLSWEGSSSYSPSERSYARAKNKRLSGKMSPRNLGLSTRQQPFQKVPSLLEHSKEFRFKYQPFNAYTEAMIRLVGRRLYASRLGFPRITPPK